MLEMGSLKFPRKASFEYFEVESLGKDKDFLEEI